MDYGSGQGVQVVDGHSDTRAIGGTTCNVSFVATTLTESSASCIVVALGCGRWVGALVLVAKPPL